MVILREIFDCVLAFVGTNLDDIVVLSFLFVSAEKSEYKKIVAGQFLGIWILTGISACAAFGLQLLSPEIARYLGVIPIIAAILYLVKSGETEESKKTSLSVWSVTGLTLADGGDNIGVYTALFGTSSADLQIIAAIVFTVMTGLWCSLGYLTTKLPRLKTVVSNHSRLIVPIVLILLGLKILFL